MKTRWKDTLPEPQDGETLIDAARYLAYALDGVAPELYVAEAAAIIRAERKRIEREHKITTERVDVGGQGDPPHLWLALQYVARAAALDYPTLLRRAEAHLREYWKSTNSQ